MIIDDVEAAAAALAELLATSRRAVVFTGAGISTESGIPDYRSPGGIWTRMKPILYDAFLASEEARLEDWRRRFRMSRDFHAAEPNAGHRAVARLVDDGVVASVVTQNIDGLHQRAGVPDDLVIELHGNAHGAACLACRHPTTLAAVEAEIDATGRAPACARCGGIVKSTIISFGQPMPADAMARATAEAERADVFLCAGSSLVVYPAASIPIIARRRGARLAILNREPTEMDDAAELVLRGPIGAILGPFAGP
jgi:NAD-dependent deacetylase